MAYKDINKKRANGRKWMAKWRADNPAEANRKGRAAHRKATRRAHKKRRISLSAFYAIKTGAEKRNLAFELKRNDIVVPEYCPVLGIPLDRRDYNHTPSVDRIDNSLGYVAGNWIVVSRRVNRLKSNATLWELRRIADYYGGLNASHSIT